jgi:hypothetical protein
MLLRSRSSTALDRVRRLARRQRRHQGIVLRAELAAEAAAHILADDADLVLWHVQRLGETAARAGRCSGSSARASADRPPSAATLPWVSRQQCAAVGVVKVSSTTTSAPQAFVHARRAGRYLALGVDQVALDACPERRRIRAAIEPSRSWTKGSSSYSTSIAASASSAMRSSVGHHKGDLGALVGQLLGKDLAPSRSVIGRRLIAMPDAPHPGQGLGAAAIDALQRAWGCGERKKRPPASPASCRSCV